MGLTDVATIRLRYVTADIDRYGTVRYYFRRKGEAKVRLPGGPGSDEFMGAYHRAFARASQPTVAATRAPLPGSFRALCVAYYGSATFRALDESTRAWRRRALDALCVDHGNKRVAKLEPRHIRKIRDAKAEKPVVANTTLKAIRALFAWAVEAEEVAHDPSRDVKPLRYASSGFHTWTMEEVAAFEAAHPVGTKARLAMALMLYSTGRREDAVRLGPQHVRGGRLRFIQAKNEHRKPVRVDMPVHPDLAMVISGTPSGHLTFLVTDYGKPFSPAGFGNRFREWCDRAGLPHCTAHGLRKATATRLAELGASAREIMAVTGHQTLEEAERYTEAADRALLADRAIARFSRGQDGNEVSHPGRMGASQLGRGGKK